MEIIIGLEIHVEINSQTKLFCSCPTHASIPNTATCPTCVGFPGSKPVFNKKVLESALKLCLALNCTIAPEVIFSRKTYFYPDMGKNYQITQYEMPLGSKGQLALSNKTIGITRVHIEEDPAALIHQGSVVLVDYNRSGKPLCEIVTEPDMNSPEDAREFLKRLITILHYLHIFDIHEGVIKADANISIKGYERVEIKNITGFKEIERALTYEIERHKKLVSESKGITQRETRGWDADKGITLFQRSKEEEADYGYIMDPDLVAIDVTEGMIEKTIKELPELPAAKTQRYIKDYKLKKDDAEAIANDYDLAQIFEHATTKVAPLFAAEWIRREVARVLNYNKKTLDETFIPEQIIDLMELLNTNQITRQTGQRLMEKLASTDISVKKYIQDNNLLIVTDTKAIEETCIKILKENQPVVQDYKKGNEKALNRLVGLVMRESRGKADAIKTTELLKKHIK